MNEIVLGSDCDELSKPKCLTANFGKKTDRDNRREGETHNPLQTGFKYTVDYIESEKENHNQINSHVSTQRQLHHDQNYPPQIKFNNYYY